MARFSSRKAKRKELEEFYDEEMGLPLSCPATKIRRLVKRSSDSLFCSLVGSLSCLFFFLGPDYVLQSILLHKQFEGRNKLSYFLKKRNIVIFCELGFFHHRVECMLLISG